MAQDRGKEPGEAAGENTRPAATDRRIAQDKAAETEAVEFTPEALTSLIGELKDALASEPEPTNKEQKKVRREQEKKINELEKHRETWRI